MRIMKEKKGTLRLTRRTTKGRPTSKSLSVRDLGDMASLKKLARWEEEVGAGNLELENDMEQ